MLLRLVKFSDMPHSAQKHSIGGLIKAFSQYPYNLNIFHYFQVAIKSKYLLIERFTFSQAWTFGFHGMCANTMLFGSPGYHSLFVDVENIRGSPCFNYHVNAKINNLGSSGDIWMNEQMWVNAQLFSKTGCRCRKRLMMETINKPNTKHIYYNYQNVQVTTHGLWHYGFHVAKVWVRVHNS